MMMMMRIVGFLFGAAVIYSRCPLQPAALLQPPKSEYDDDDDGDDCGDDYVGTGEVFKN